MKFFSFDRLVKFSLIDKFEATPPAITKVFFLVLFFFLNSLNATLLFLKKIYSIVF